jgi:aerobic-type carbon monoxide dehydrogenase small subunit (CoxS/CutS family)
MGEMVESQKSKVESRNNIHNSNEKSGVELFVNGNSIRVDGGTMVSAALAAAGVTAFRRSVGGEPRSPLCGMGICFECRVTIDGEPHQRSCQIPCAPGMKVAAGE